MKNVNLVAKVFGIYWLVTGIWPFVHMPSFIFVTGPKHDLWLVYTVSILIFAIGFVVLVAGLKKAVTAEIKLLAIISAAGLTGIDVYFSSTNEIADIYRYDAAVELLIICWWLWAGNSGIAKTHCHEK
ncbi:MAG: hypothetical protein LPJ89_07975 [Hymenobacteraceae bacterium]|nr:hypothetical protein [Hymenobacteraceae bacterium]MDX5395931.1 hypothetical protein [Hymenobacteraceae bacterium]MDX5443700.1 hypothetical protein [Hymenobacteraceae bacterium]MDX5511989.1 hypothetical protein [Hymenobacteraceae bacterium]